MANEAIGAVLQQLQPNNDGPQVTVGTTGTIVERTFNLRRDRVKQVFEALTIGDQDNEWTDSFLQCME